MFKINPEPLFTADVPLTVPGQADPVVVKMTFRYKDKVALIDFERRLSDKKSKIEDMLVEIIESWTGIDAPCNGDSVKAIAANYIAAPAEIIAAYNRELIRSKVKN